MMQQKAKLEDLLMERRSSEERRKKAELGYDKSVRCLMWHPLSLPSSSVNWSVFNSSQPLLTICGTSDRE